jgi:hypothetical protein
VTAEIADGAGDADATEPAGGDLPTRPARCLPLQRIRRMDDPEILERVLEGLVRLI